MIQKLTFKSIISKYYLSGLIEQVRWEIDKENLIIKFNAPSKEMLGEVIYDKLPLVDSTFGISNTTQLLKLVDITNDILQLSVTKQGKVCSKLLIADKQFSLNYALADIITIPKAGVLPQEPEFDIVVNLENEDITSMIKAQSALDNNEIVLIQPALSSDAEPEIEFIFGGDVEYANKVSYYLKNPIIKTPTQYRLYFNSTLIKQILSSNKDQEQGTLSISFHGLIKLEFKTDGLISKYYIVQKEI